MTENEPESALAQRMYRMFLMIRRVEEEIVRIYPSDDIKSPVHLSIGQEAAAVGVSLALDKDDVAFATYRSHAAYIAKGGRLDSMFAELYGKEDGSSRGRGGSMHMIDLDCGLMGTSAIVASTISLAVGYAWACKQQNRPNIVVCYFGDGATEEGCFHESLNFAALKGLPILFVCENNAYAIYSHVNARMANPTIADRVSPYNIPTHRIQSGDVREIYECTQRTRETMTSTPGGPQFLEIDTCRWFDHVGINDDTVLNYRSTDELSRWKENDPLPTLASMLDPDVEQQIAREVEQEIAAAIQFAENSAFPGNEELLYFVTQ